MVWLLLNGELTEIWSTKRSAMRRANQLMAEYQKDRPNLTYTTTISNGFIYYRPSNYDEDIQIELLEHEIKNSKSFTGKGISVKNNYSLQCTVKSEDNDFDQ